MRNARLYRSEAIIIKRTDFGEKDRLLTIYTPGLGKMRVLAKGIRRPGSKLAGYLELFSRSHLLMAKGRNLDIVTQGEIVDCFPSLRLDLLLTTYAHYACEVIDRTTPDHLEDYPLYSLLVTTLGRLDAHWPSSIAIHLFELKLLEHLGYGPELHKCTCCDHPLQPVENYFCTDGGVLCPPCGAERGTAHPLSLNALKVLRLLQREDCAVAGRLRLDEPLRQELETHLRSTLQRVMERGIKSAAFLNQLRAESIPTV